MNLPNTPEFVTVSDYVLGSASSAVPDGPLNRELNKLQENDEFQEISVAPFETKAAASASVSLVAGMRIRILGEAEPFYVVTGVNPEAGNPIQGVGLDSAVPGVYLERQYNGDVHVAWFGAHGKDDYDNPTEDFSDEIEAATVYAASVDKPLMFGPGVYRITRQILQDSDPLYPERPSVTTFHWKSIWGNVKSNQFIESRGPGQRYKTAIVVDIQNGDDWLFSCRSFKASDYGAEHAYFGPYMIEGFVFKFSTDNRASGFRFGGRESSGPYDHLNAGMFVFGVRFKGCYFTGPVHLGLDDNKEFIPTTVSCPYFLQICRCYEGEIEDVSFRGSKVQVDLYRNDNFRTKRVRAQQGYYMLFDSEGVYDIVDNWQFEGFRGPMAVDAHKTLMSNCRFEGGYGFNVGRYLTKQSISGPTLTYATSAGDNWISVTFPVDAPAEADSVADIFEVGGSLQIESTGERIKVAELDDAGGRIKSATTLENNITAETFMLLATVNYTAAANPASSPSDELSITLPKGVTIDQFFDAPMCVEVEASDFIYKLVVDEVDTISNKLVFRNSSSHFFIDSDISDAPIFRFFGTHGVFNQSSVHNSTMGFNNNPTSSFTGDNRLPVAVVVPGGAPTNMVGVTNGYGSGMTSRTRVEVWGHTQGRQFLMQGGLNWIGGSAVIAPRTDDPWTNFVGFAYGISAAGNANHAPRKCENLLLTEDVWNLTPKSGSASFAYSASNYFTVVDEKSVWWLRQKFPLVVSDSAHPIPYGMSGRRWKVEILAKSKGTSSLSIQHFQNPTATTIVAETFGNTWKRFSVEFDNPAAWEAENNFLGLRFLVASGDDIYIAQAKLTLLPDDSTTVKGVDIFNRPNTWVSDGLVINLTSSWYGETFEIETTSGDPLKYAYNATTHTISDTDVIAGIDTITKVGHGWLTGQCVHYAAGSGSIDSMSGTMFVIRVNDDSFKLATSRANAVAGTAFDIVTVNAGDFTLQSVYTDGDQITFDEAVATTITKVDGFGYLWNTKSRTTLDLNPDVSSGRFDPIATDKEYWLGVRLSVNTTSTDPEYALYKITYDASLDTWAVVLYDSEDPDGSINYDFSAGNIVIDATNNTLYVRPLSEFHTQNIFLSYIYSESFSEANDYLESI